MARYLTVSDVTTLNDRILLRMEQWHGQLLNAHALIGAMSRPGFTEAYMGADLIEQTVYLVEGLALAHAFLNGNKRTAWIAGRVFLRLNGLRFRLLPDDAPDEAGRQVEALVLPDRPQDSRDRFIAWLRTRVSPSH